MLVQLSNFPQRSIQVYDPRPGDSASSFREQNSDYVRAATAFFAILDGVDDVLALSARIRLAFTWQGNDVTRMRHQVMDADGKFICWSDWHNQCSRCAEFHVLNAQGITAARLFAYGGNGYRSLLARIEGDTFSLFDNLHFWGHDHEGYPSAAGNLLDREQEQLRQFLIELCLRRVERLRD